MGILILYFICMLMRVSNTVSSGIGKMQYTNKRRHIIT